MAAPGFHIYPDGTIYFKAIKKFKVNTDWSLSLDEIAGIAICNTMYGDWDADFLVIFRKNGKTLHHAMGAYVSFPEEQVGFEPFWQLLIDRFQAPSKYSECLKNDSTVLIYPKGHENEPVYLKWHESLAAFKLMLKREIRHAHCASGLLRPGMIAWMGLGKD